MRSYEITLMLMVSGHMLRSPSGPDVRDEKDARHNISNDRSEPVAAACLRCHPADAQPSATVYPFFKNDYPPFHILVGSCSLSYGASFEDRRCETADRHGD